MDKQAWLNVLGLPSVRLGHSRRACGGDSVCMVRVTLPSHCATAGNIDVLVLDNLSGLQVDRHSPQGVGGGVLISAQSDGLASIPAAQLGNVTNDLDCLPILSRYELIESDCNGSSRRAASGGRGGRGR